MVFGALLTSLGPSEWDLSIAAPAAAGNSAVPLLHPNWELRDGGQGLPFFPVTWNPVSVSVSALQNGQIIVLCHFFVPTPDWKGCLTSRDVLCVRRSIRFAQCPFWSFFFFLVSLFMLPGLISVAAYPLYRFCSLLHLKENLFPIKWWLLLLLIPGFK